MRRKVNTFTDLAEALGADVMAVHKWVDGPEWTFGKQPPWEVDQVRAWVRAHVNKAAQKPASRGSTRKVRSVGTGGTPHRGK
jgi:hypothetical protein